MRQNIKNIVPVNKLNLFLISFIRAFEWNAF